MKTSLDEQIGGRETETAAWEQDWLQAEQELTEISERDKAEAAVWRDMAVRRRRDVHRITVCPEHKKNAQTADERMSAGSEDEPMPRAFPNPAPSESILLQKGMAVALGFFIFLNVLWMCYRAQ